MPSLSSSSSEKGDVHIISSTLVVAREEVADIRGVIWLGLCAASSVTIHFPHPPLYYSLVHLVRPKMEELISQMLLGLFKIRLLFQDRVRSQNLRLEWQCLTNQLLF